MKFLIAPNAFKGTIPANEAAGIIAHAIQETISSAEFLIQPVADGGDGTCELLIDSLGLEKVFCWSLNAVGQPLQGYFGWHKSSKTAYLDVSTCSGLGSLQDVQKDPFVTSTFGTGIIINEALNLGAEEIILGLGGSATVDIGSGILAALGFIFLDENGREIPVYSPGFFEKCKHIQHPVRIPKVRFTCLCDVRNLFFGNQGAIPVFGPQKGLKREQLIPFEKSASDFVQLFIKKSKKSFQDQPGYGAAGGIALGLSLFFDTKIEFGSTYFFSRVELEKKVPMADWIITGEGKFDSQSVEGKAAFELLELAKTHRKKIAIVTSGDEAYSAGFDLVLELPTLDFLDSRYKQKARENLHGLIKSSAKLGKFG